MLSGSFLAQSEASVAAASCTQEVGSPSAQGPALPQRRPPLPPPSLGMSHWEVDLLRSGLRRLRKIGEPGQADGEGDQTNSIFLNHTWIIQRKKKTTVVVNWLLSDDKQGAKWGIWHQAWAISETIHLRQIQPWLQPRATKCKEFLQISAHLPPRDCSESKSANKGLLPGANLCKSEQKERAYLPFNSHQEELPWN